MIKYRTNRKKGLHSSSQKINQPQVLVAVTTDDESDETLLSVLIKDP